MRRAITMGSNPRWNPYVVTQRPGQEFPLAPLVQTSIRINRTTHANLRRVSWATGFHISELVDFACQKLLYELDAQPEPAVSPLPHVDLKERWEARRPHEQIIPEDATFDDA